jgi:hypothetical protein
MESKLEKDKVQISPQQAIFNPLLGGAAVGARKPFEKSMDSGGARYADPKKKAQKQALMQRQRKNLAIKLVAT